MPKCTNFMKEILRNKRKLVDHETVMLNEECNAILLNKLPPKLKDPGSLYTLHYRKLGASINLIVSLYFQGIGFGRTDADYCLTPISG